MEVRTRSYHVGQDLHGQLKRSIFLLKVSVEASDMGVYVRGSQRPLGEVILGHNNKEHLRQVSGCLGWVMFQGCALD